MRPGTWAAFAGTGPGYVLGGRRGGAEGGRSLLIGRRAPRGRQPHPSGSARGPFERRARPRAPQRPEARGRRWQLSDGDRGRQPPSPGPGPSARPASGRSPTCEPGRGSGKGQPRRCAGREAARLVLSSPVLTSLVLANEAPPS